tara:strand:+ start:813 stop:1874 length:1062 start_codon:yes stop_codon:yes gene_type:complete
MKFKFIFILCFISKVFVSAATSYEIMKMIDFPFLENIEDQIIEHICVYSSIKSPERLYHRAKLEALYRQKFSAQELSLIYEKLENTYSSDIKKYDDSLVDLVKLASAEFQKKYLEYMQKKEVITVRKLYLRESTCSEDNILKLVEEIFGVLSFREPRSDSVDGKVLKALITMNQVKELEKLFRNNYTESYQFYNSLENDLMEQFLNYRYDLLVILFREFYNHCLWKENTEMSYLGMTLGVEDQEREKFRHLNESRTLSMFDLDPVFFELKKIKREQKELKALYQSRDLTIDEKKDYNRAQMKLEKKSIDLYKLLKVNEQKNKLDRDLLESLKMNTQINQQQKRNLMPIRKNKR